uniref:4Fe-4S ferredoxin-type domain-containing protein n=1 Tax=Hanusia phi TaxID=3032 RepID=A0A7S0EJD4_9CRYP|mmetsp:Transcript_25549/g.57483  ORF Transcript_25549/g.57483 Transcript_25549/m.57483 type:complete len:191 (+) Transcript_25549:2-574(+)
MKTVTHLDSCGLTMIKIPRNTMHRQTTGAAKRVNEPLNRCSGCPLCSAGVCRAGVLLFDEKFLFFLVAVPFDGVGSPLAVEILPSSPSRHPASSWEAARAIAVKVLEGMGLKAVHVPESVKMVEVPLPDGRHVAQCYCVKISNKDLGNNLIHRAKFVDGYIMSEAPDFLPSRVQMDPSTLKVLDKFLQLE